MKKVYFYSLDVQHIIGFCSKCISNTRIKLRTYLFSLIFNDKEGLRKMKIIAQPFTTVMSLKSHPKT